MKNAMTIDKHLNANYTLRNNKIIHSPTELNSGEKV